MLPSQINLKTDFLSEMIQRCSKVLLCAVSSCTRWSMLISLTVYQSTSCLPNKDKSAGWMFPVKFSQLNCEIFIKIHQAVVRIVHHSLCLQNQRTMDTYKTCMTFAAPSSITVEMKKIRACWEWSSLSSARSRHFIDRRNRNIWKACQLGPNIWLFFFFDE